MEQELKLIEEERYSRIIDKWVNKKLLNEPCKLWSSEFLEKIRTLTMTNCSLIIRSSDIWNSLSHLNKGNALEEAFRTNYLQYHD